MNNHLCFICDRPAVRVCVRPECDKYPFLCGDQCKNQQNAALLIHTQHGSSQFIPVEEMLAKVLSIQDPTHNEHLNSMRKRVNVLIGELNDLMNKYQSELKKLQPQLNGKAKRIIECITIKENNKHLKGKDLADLMDKKDVYEDQPAIEILVEKVKGIMEEKVQKLENIGIGNTLNTQRAEEHLSKGNELYDSGKYKQALEEYILARQCSPLQPLYVFRIGVCYDYLNEKQEAVKHYEERISMGGEGEDLAKSYNNMGLIKGKRGEYEKAIEYYSKALALKGDYADCYNNRGNAYRNMKRYQEAVKEYTRAIGINGNNADYYYNRGNTYRNMNKNQEAVKEYTKAIQINSGNDGYYCNRGRAYQNMGRYKEAVQDYTKAISIRPTKKYYNNRANAYQKMGEVEKAREDRESSKSAPG